MSDHEAPALAGVHHLKLPVADLRRSQRWYESRLGYELVVEFQTDGELDGICLVHPNGGPNLGLRLDPERARAAAGFDYFSIGVSDESTLRALGDRLTELGERHAGVQPATLGWILPLLHDPDGHEVRFYTVQHHTEPDPEHVLVVDNPVEAARRNAAARAEHAVG
jgi:catechol 2,3-dioxygenase-like lactoylglutathione lyase family enzyme